MILRRCDCKLTMDRGRSSRRSVRGRGLEPSMRFAVAGDGDVSQQTMNIRATFAVSYKCTNIRLIISFIYILITLHGANSSTFCPIQFRTKIKRRNNSRSIFTICIEFYFLFHIKTQLSKIPHSHSYFTPPPIIDFSRGVDHIPHKVFFGYLPRIGCAR